MDQAAKEIEANGGQVEVDLQVPENCPKSVIREAFRPIAVFGKCFGLFPRYDLSFTENLTDHHLKIVHILECAYFVLMVALLTSGGILCAIRTPTTIQYLTNTREQTDLIVILTSFNLILVMGLLSLFVFPRQSSKVLRYIDRFAQVDKILCFGGKHQDSERNFSRRYIFKMLVGILGTCAIYYVVFLLVDPEKPKSQTDYLMPPLAAMATAMHVIPTSAFIFFLNGIRARLAMFNEKMQNLILPITPSCFSCESYSDYGDELMVCPRLSSTLLEDLDKMRVLHEEISSLTSETSAIFGSHIIREFIFTIVSVICYTYFVVFMLEKQPTYMFVYPFMDIFVLGKLHYISTFAHLVTVESSSSLRLLNKVCFLRLSPECALQIEAFIKKLEKPNVVTAAGYFEVNRVVLSSILGAITTYFIILVQFKVSDHSLTFENMAYCGDPVCNSSSSAFLLEMYKQ